MSKILVLGGCGAVGSVAVRKLAQRPEFEQILIGDINREKAQALAMAIANERAHSWVREGVRVPVPQVTARAVDVTDPASLQQALAGVELVLNCVGPFYKTVKGILKTVMECGVNYVDVCDDVDATEEILGWSEEAEQAGITALIGMGSSPGVTNLLAAFAANTLLEETYSVDIFHAHGGEPFEGPGVIGHRFHCMSIDIPMFLDGELKTVQYFGEDGIALRERYRFPVLDEEALLYPYPHPEQITLPRYCTLRQVTNKGTVLPSPYYELTRDLCALGLSSRAPVQVGDQAVVPYDFSVAYIIQERERILKETQFGQQRGCVSVIVKGKNAGQPQEFRFHLASKSEALGEGTGIPAAMGVLLLQQGKISRKGIFPPEAGVNPLDFLALLPEVMPEVRAGTSGKKNGESFSGVIVERVDPDGTITPVEIM